MFISVEKAMALTGRSKNALYRQMARGYIHFVCCTRGKRYVEVAELRRLYGELGEVSEPSPLLSTEQSISRGELLQSVASLRTELANLSLKVDKQTQLIESLSGTIPTIPPDVVTALSARPELDPEWPPFITCYADLAKRDEIKARYSITTSI
jgi:hypothetical protein